MLEKKNKQKKNKTQNQQNNQRNQNQFVIVCKNAQGNSKGWVCVGVSVVSQVRLTLFMT